LEGSLPSAQWPRQCELLFGINENDNEPCFFHTQRVAGDADDIPHPFTACVLDVARK
jgi:hypothetical protein